MNALYRDYFSEQLPETLFKFDNDTLSTYSHDTSNLEYQLASAVFFPRCTQDIAVFLKLCSKHKIQVVPSGGRTGLSGGSVVTTNEIIISLEKMNQIEPVNLFSKTVRVEAGVITQAIHEHCQPHGLIWPVDFASKGSSQIGGNLATNAGGVNVIHYGMSRNWVQSIKTVLMDGTILELNGDLEKNNSGLDLRHLFIGSEGILGVIAEATLRLTKFIKNRQVLILGLNTTSELEQTITWAKCNIPSMLACEYISSQCFEITKSGHCLPPVFKTPFPHYLLLECENEFSDLLFEQNCPFSLEDCVVSSNPTQFKNLWSYRERISETISRAEFVLRTDISVPIPVLWNFIDAIHKLLSNSYQSMQVFIFGHIGDGNLHIDFTSQSNKTTQEFKQTFKNLEPQYYELIRSFRGSVSAEHGVGLLKKHCLKYTRSPEEIEIFRKIKAVFDPQGLMNPGKVFSSHPDPKTK